MSRLSERASWFDHRRYDDEEAGNLKDSRLQDPS
jgi:hypothetical protein